jgi:hypothetical protein
LGGWQDCCPNDATLRMFSVLEGCRHEERPVPQMAPRISK